MMKKPNLFIVGAAKSGTTSLYNYLNSHPDIYMSPIKEPNYFSKDINPENFRKDYRNSVYIDIDAYLSQKHLTPIHIAFIKDLDKYLELFREAKNEVILGEISNSYLYSKVAAEEIYKFNPNSKIIMILRNPIDRAYSHFIMNLTEGLTKYNKFLDEVLYDYQKSIKGWGISHLYIELGLYYEQVKRYLSIFPQENIKIIIYDDYIKNTKQVVEDIFSFLEVDSTIVEDIDFSKRFMQGYIPKSQFINIFLKKFYRKLDKILPDKVSQILISHYKNLMTNKKSPLTKEEKELLLEIFENDIINLSKLIHRDLTEWIKM